MRISLTEKNGEIKGKIEVDGDNLFVFECLVESITTLCMSRGIPPDEFARDLAAWIGKNRVACTKTQED